MKGTIITKTPCLLLRQFNAGDAEALREVLCSPEVMFFSMRVMEPVDFPRRIDGRPEVEVGFRLSRRFLVPRVGTEAAAATLGYGFRYLERHQKDAGVVVDDRLFSVTSRPEHEHAADLPIPTYGVSG